MPGFFLKFYQPVTDKIQKLLGKCLSPCIGNVMLVIGKIPYHLVHAVDANGREVIAQRTQISLGKREQPVINQALNNLTLDFQRRARNVH